MFFCLNRRSNIIVIVIVFKPTHFFQFIQVILKSDLISDLQDHDLDLDLQDHSILSDLILINFHRLLVRGLPPPLPPTHTHTHKTFFFYYKPTA